MNPREFSQAERCAARLNHWQHLVFGASQPQYLPLPAFKDPGPHGTVITRWQLSWRERLALLFGGDLYLIVLTFGEALQPLMPEVGLHLTSFAPVEQPDPSMLPEGV